MGREGLSQYKSNSAHTGVVIPVCYSITVQEMSSVNQTKWPTLQGLCQTLQQSTRLDVQRHQYRYPTARMQIITR